MITDVNLVVAGQEARRKEGSGMAGLLLNPSTADERRSKHKRSSATPSTHSSSSTSSSSIAPQGKRAATKSVAAAVAPVLTASSGALLPLGSSSALGTITGSTEQQSSLPPLPHQPSPAVAAAAPAPPRSTTVAVAAAADKAMDTVLVKVRQPPSTTAPEGKITKVKVKLHEPMTKIFAHFGEYCAPICLLYRLPELLRPRM
jgi:hypothetical protein